MYYEYINVGHISRLYWSISVLLGRIIVGSHAIDEYAGNKIICTCCLLCNLQSLFNSIHENSMVTELSTPIKPACGLGPLHWYTVGVCGLLQPVHPYNIFSAWTHPTSRVLWVWCLTLWILFDWLAVLEGPALWSLIVWGVELVITQSLWPIFLVTR